VEDGVWHVAPNEWEEVIGKLERRLDVRGIAKVTMEHERVPRLRYIDRMEIFGIRPIRDEVDASGRNDSADLVHVRLRYHGAALVPGKNQPLVAWLVKAEE
jgi:hypothetical protein